MTRFAILPVVCALALPLHAQSTLASRIAQVKDGTVRMEYAARPGACGNGKDMVGYRHAMFARSYEGWGTWNGVSCNAGPLRVTLSVVNGVPTSARTQIGGAWPPTEERVTDLGTVDSRQAAAYFFSIVPRLEETPARDRILLPAVLAADAPAVAPLTTIARDAARTDRTRRQAVQWLGLVGDASVIPTLVAFARQPDFAEKKSVGGAALSALAYLEDGVGTPALLELSHEQAVPLRKESMFWLGQSGDPRAVRRLHDVIEDSSEDMTVRAHAIFSLANGESADAKAFQYLRTSFAKLNGEKLKDAVLQAESQDDVNGGKWLIERARDANESTETRKKALFWAGQREATSTSDLVSVYRDAGDDALREHAIFVLSQRQDDGATDALMKIARDDNEKRMRGKALFWLAQKHDPRVTKMISDILVK